MGQHHALGPAAGARGVDEAGEIVAAQVASAWSIAGAAAPRASALGPGQRSAPARRCAASASMNRIETARVGRLRHRRQQPLGQRLARSRSPPRPRHGRAGRRDRRWCWWCRPGTVTPPAIRIARSATHHSGRFSARISTRSPGAMPRAARQRARSRASSPGPPPAPGPIDAVALGPQERAARRAWRPSARTWPRDWCRDRAWASFVQGSPELAQCARASGAAPPGRRAMLEARRQRPISRGLQRQRERDGDARAGAAADEGERGVAASLAPAEQGPVWNLGRPLSRRSTIRVSRPISRRSTADAAALEAEFKGRLAEFDGDGLAGMIERYEAIEDRIGRVFSFAQLLFAAQSRRSRRSASSTRACRSA